MGPQQCLAVLAEWERRFPVDAWKLGGLHAWPLVRAQLATSLLGSQQPTDGRRTARHQACAALWQRMLPLRCFGSYVRAVRADRGHNARLAGKVDAVFLSTCTNRVLVDGQWYDRHCDPIADLLRQEGKRVLTLEHARSTGPYRTPRYQDSRFIEPGLWAARVKAHLLRKPRDVPDHSLDEYPAFLEALRDQGLETARHSVCSLQRSLATINSLAAYFEAILRRAAPQVAFVICYYDTVGMAYTLAAHRCGIPSVDIQHGNNRNHRAYCNWHKVPQGGYELLPRVFWCWSEDQAAPIEQWATSAHAGHQALVGGQPWECLWTGGSSALPGGYHRAISEIKSERPGMHHLLLSLQWDKGLTPLLQEVLSHSPPDCFWWVRLHPAMKDRTAVKGWLQHHLPGRAEVDVASDCPLPLLLDSMVGHVTRYSSVVLEAKSQGVRSVVVDSKACDYYQHELATGWAWFTEDLAGILARLAALCRNGACSPEPHRTDGLQTMRRAVRQLFTDLV